MILSFLEVWLNRLLELFQNGEDVGFDYKLDEDILEAYFLYCFLKGGVGEYDIVTVAVDKEDVFVLNFCVASGDAGVF